MKQNFMSMREYARHRGVVVGTVELAIATGRINVSHQDGNKKMIDQIQADIDWAANTQTKFGGHEDKESAEVPQSGAAAERLPTASSQLQAARVKKEEQLAKLKELEFNEKSGLVIEKSIVEKVVSKFAANARDALLNLPQRLAAELAAETDPHLIELKLDEELRRVMDDFCNARLRY